MTWEEIEKILIVPTKKPPSLELPEDALFHMMKKNKKLQKLIDTFELDLIF